jgi:hypothetical protein
MENSRVILTDEAVGMSMYYLASVRTYDLLLRIRNRGLYSSFGPNIVKSAYCFSRDILEEYNVYT